MQNGKSDKADANSNIPSHVMIIAFLCILIVLSVIVGFVLASRRKKNKQQNDKNEDQTGKLRIF